MPNISGSRFFGAVKNCVLEHQSQIFNESDWLEWRYCYEGGRVFRDEYLQKFVGTVGQEGAEAFQRRRDMTPIPAYAKKAINNVKNAVARRLRDVSRPGGSELYTNWAAGKSRGVDMKGSSMNSYLTKYVLPEVLVMGRCGLLVDAPRLRPKDGRRFVTRADVPDFFQPYLCRFPVECIPIAIRATPTSPSDWSHVLVESTEHEFNLLSGKEDCKTSYRYFWLEDEDPARMGKVNTVTLDTQGELSTDVRKLDLDRIPFIMFELDNSLMVDVCSYQIALLNMMSADSAYAIDSNFPFLTRQRAATEFGDHLDEGRGGDSIRVGTDRGLNYGRGLERPGFISPPSEPLRASVELRREMKQEVHELVLGTLADMGEGSVEAGLKVIGEELETGENRIVDHFVVYEERIESNRQPATISYPDSWSLKTDEERLNEAQKALELSEKVIGVTNKKTLVKQAVWSLNAGVSSADSLAELMKEIDDSPLGTANSDVIISAKEMGILCIETCAAALGAKDPVKEAKCSQEEAAERAAMVTQAQADANTAGRGNPAHMADPNSERIAREGETKGDGNLKPPGKPGRPSNGDND